MGAHTWEGIQSPAPVSAFIAIGVTEGIPWIGVSTVVVGGSLEPSLGNLANPVLKVKTKVCWTGAELSGRAPAQHA